MTTPFVPTYRQFPTQDAHNLEKQLVNSYTQLATATNNKIIGNFPLHIVGDADFVPNGERWFPTTAQLNSSPQRLRDGFRVVVQVSDATTLTVAHNIQVINQLTRLYGTFFDGAAWRPLPYVDVVAANNQINISVTATQIVVTKGGGAPPTVASGIVVLEYL